MKLYLYSIYSDLSDLYAGEGLFMYRTDKQALHVIGSKLPAEEKANCKIVRVGSFDMETGFIEPESPVVLGWLSGIDSISTQSPISHEPPEVQSSKFQEKIAGVSR